MKEEVKRILKMVEEGKIDSDKATELIEALNKSSNDTQLTAASNLDKMLKVKVLSATQDTVNVNVPVKFLKAIGNAVNNIKIPGVSEQEGIDIKMIMEAIDSGLEGKIVDVKSGNGDIVEVSIE
ncbi:SHOCT-like domain-containing protein [Candidatus Clostridium radicumherbarum]|uniref:SHOCT-like domain-containing protein n=1 Tax=Candidatus Clostridium radicumherbarum TaxID=3381662 RepID=A0ABW8TW25_9CLOT